MRTELFGLDDVGPGRVTRHEDKSFETGSRGVSGEGGPGVSGAGRSELGRAEMFRHGNGYRHAARLKTLRRVQRFVFDVKIFELEPRCQPIGAK
jgi:hypothetical protein